MNKFRLKCDHCKRIISSDADNSFPCSACGHGVLRIQRPKNCCDTCGIHIYDNVGPPPVRMTCGDCTWGLIVKVRYVEETSGVLLGQHNGKKKRKAKNVTKGNQGRYKGSKRLFQEVKELSEFKTEAYNMAEQLGTIRKAAGLPQRLLAEELGISPGHLCEMEHGRKPLTLEAFKWVKQNAPKQSAEGGILVNEQKTSPL